MRVLKSSIDVRSDEFHRSAEIMTGLVADLREKVARVRLGGDENSRTRHVERCSMQSAPTKRASR